MTFVQATQGAGGEKHRFECKRCIVVYTEVGGGTGEPAPDRARKLHNEPIRTLH
jgi:hypothetical protein